MSILDTSPSSGSCSFYQTTFYVESSLVKIEAITNTKKKQKTWIWAQVQKWTQAQAWDLTAIVELPLEFGDDI